MNSQLWHEPPLKEVADLIRQRCGLSFVGARAVEAQRSFTRFMRENHLANGCELLTLVQNSQAAQDELISALTVGETYFFREPRQFEFIRQVVIPEFRARQSPGRPWNVWSAGCATGEEAHSLAILAEQEGMAHRCRIAGTDICRQSVLAAREAVFGGWSLRGVHSDLVQRYFVKTGSKYRLKERIRAAVSFSCLNLVGGLYPTLGGNIRDMDLILCRNVMIYLDAEFIEVVARKLYATLAEGGWLVIGPSDPLVSQFAPFEPVVTPAGVFYKKPAASESARRWPGAASGNAAATAHESVEVESSSAPQEFQRLPAKNQGMRHREKSPAADRSGAPARFEPGLDQIPDLELGASRAFASGDYQSVIEGVSGCDASPDLLALQIKSVANLGGSAAALKVASEAAAVYPLASELHYLTAVLLLDLGRLNEAAQAVRRVLYLDPRQPVPHFLLGLIKRQEGDLDAARRCFRKARALAEDLAPASVIPL